MYMLTYTLQAAVPGSKRPSDLGSPTLGLDGGEGAYPEDQTRIVRHGGCRVDPPGAIGEIEAGITWARVSIVGF